MLWKEDLAVISLAPVIGTVHEGGEKDVCVVNKDTSSSSILGSDYLTSYATVVTSRGWRITSSFETKPLRDDYR